MSSYKLPVFGWMNMGYEKRLCSRTGGYEWHGTLLRD